MPWTLGELASVVGAAEVSSPDFVVTRPVPADSDDPTGLAFCSNARYLRQALAHGVGALILPPGLDADLPYLRCADPRLAFARFLELCRRPLPLAGGVHASAVVDPSASIDASASIGPYAVVERGAVIGPRARVFPFCYVGENCVVGADTVLYPHVVLYQDVRVGERCVVHAHAVLGADGFGFVWDGSAQRKVEQVGSVVIGDDVELGAGSAVDRATSGETVVGDGVKIDNHVQIGHNVSVGPHSVICGQSAVGGSAVLGRHVTMAGNTGVVDHAVLGDDVTLAVRTLAMRDIPDAGVYYGQPAMPAAQGLRAAALIASLPELHRRIQALEDRL